MHLAVEWIRLNEQSYPDFIEGRVTHAENQPIENVANQSAEHGAAVPGRPVERSVRYQWQNRERAEEPPQDRVPHAPTHARTVAEYISLEQQSENHAHQHRNEKLQDQGGGA